MVAFDGGFVVWCHTIFAYSAFLAALVVGYQLHFYKIVENAHYSYPDEWFPSVSATIGDRYPERSIFQIGIALTAMPRFLMIGYHWVRTKSTFGAAIGILRTMTCGGWVYITSTDHHDIHDVFMILYIVLTIPWDLFVLKYAEWNKPLRSLVAVSFFGTLVPLIYWFIQHNVKRRAGAYSIYAYFEWLLVILDILFDGLSSRDLEIVSIVTKVAQISSNIKKPVYNEKETNREECTDGSSSDEIVEDISLKEINIVIEEHEDIVYASTHSTIKQDSMLYIIVNIFDSFMFWTNITSLLCMIWYFPLWLLGISGYECAVLSVLSPILLSIPLAPMIIHQYGPLLANVVGVVAYLIPQREIRLITVSVAAAISVMNVVHRIRFIAGDRTRIVQYSITWTLGLVASVILKMAFYSNSPIWPIMNEENGGWNKTGLVLCTIMALITPYTNGCHYDLTAPLPSTLQTKFSSFKKLLASIGFGALFFSIHQLLTDSSTILYWCWEGWTKGFNMDPVRSPFGSLVCVIMAFVAVSSWKKAHSTKVAPRWLLVLSTAVLCCDYITGWQKFLFGGIPYVTAILLFIPNYFLTMNQVGNLGFMTAFLVYVLFVLAHVWTVAYAFVPFGWILRERLGLVLAAATTLVITGSHEYSEPVHITRSFLNRLFIVLFWFIIAIGTVTRQLQFPSELPQPYHPESKLITSGIWTIHFGFDNELWASERKIIELIKDMELDIVGLLETDTQRITTGNRDLTVRMAHELGMYTDYGPGPNKHTWGCVLLSKFPIIESTHYLLPSPVGELAPAIHAVIEAYGELVDVYVFHSGQEEDELDRKLQSEAMRDIMGASNRPAIFLGYLVTKPHQGNYLNYVSNTSGMKDIDPEDDDRWCQYILFKNLKRVGYSRVSRGSITDTELQVGKFQLHHGFSEGINRIDKDHVNEDIRFPDKFLGDGERGHRYHVFKEPRYYD